MLATSYHMNSLLDAFQLVQDLEISLKFSSEKRLPSKIEEQPKRLFESSTKTDTSNTKDPKGKSVIVSHLSRVLRN